MRASKPGCEERAKLSPISTHLSILSYDDPHQDLPIFQYSVRRLLVLFRAEVIVDMLACASLERQIIIYSDGKFTFISVILLLHTQLYIKHFQNIFRL